MHTRHQLRGWMYCGLLSVVIAMLVVLPAVGQERFGSVSGVVTDPSGAVVAGAKITVVNKATNRALAATTRNDGSFIVTEVEPGRYNVNIEKEGFSKQQTTDVMVLVGKAAKVDGVLKLGSTTETVEVSGTSIAIDTSSTMIAQNVTIEELDHLPKPRNFQGVAIFSPAVSTGYIEGGFQINGASSSENQYYIDGVPTTSIIDGSARQSATFDYLQEVQVKTTGLDAEYGGAIGGVVSAVTRSGGNSYHGDIHYYYYGNTLSTDPTRRLAIDPSVNPEDTIPYPTAYFQDGKFLNDNHEIGGTLGGPILKDRLWFFVAGSPRWQQRRNDYQFVDGPGAMTRHFHKENWFGKLSWDATRRIRANFTFLYTPEYQAGALYAYDGFQRNGSLSTLDIARSESQRGYNQPENSVTGQIDFTLTNKSVLSVKGGRYFLDYKDVGVAANKQYNWITGSTDTAGVDPAYQFDSGHQSASAQQTLHDITTRTYVQGDFLQSFNFGGQHNLKLGGGLQKNVNNVNDNLAPDGRVNFFWGTAPCTVCGPNVNTGEFAVGAFGYYSVDLFGTIGTAGSNITHLYVQDSWQLFRRLTINAGVRFEKEVIPSFRPDVQKIALEWGFGDKIAPRLGASFDLLGNGKIKLSGGWGRYYDWIKYDLPRGTFGGDVWHVFYRTLDSADKGYLDSISLSNMPGTDIWTAGHPSSTFRDRRVPGFDFLDTAVKPPSSDALNAGVEWEIAPKMVFTGRYVRVNLNRTIEDMGVLEDGQEVYRYGNPGEGRNTIEPASGASCPILSDGACAVPMPKARRTYDAMELSLGRRFSSGYLFNANYTYSRLYGNYSGTQSTDEIRPATLGYGFSGNQQYAAQTYRPGGNANRYFDLDEALYDSHGVLGLNGLLPTDRPSVFKFYGAKTFKIGTEIGGFFRASSGTPVTTQAESANQIPIYVNGRGDMGRTPFFNQTDLMVAHEFKLGEAKRLRLEMNVMNIFNQKTSVFTFDRYIREEHSEVSGMDLSGVDLTQGFDYKALAASSCPTCGRPEGDLDTRYGLASDFNPGLSARFLVKFSF